MSSQGWSDNRALYVLFNRFADLLEIAGGDDARKASSYRRAAISLRNLDQPVAAVGDLRSIAGIGPVLAAKIKEYLETGRIPALDRLQEQLPAGVMELLELPGVGPRTVATLWHRAGVGSVADLREAGSRLAALPGFGPKKIASLLAAAAGQQKRGMLLSEALDLSEALVARLPGRAAVAGEPRRGCPLCSAIVLVATGEPKTIAEVLGALAIWSEAPVAASGAVTGTLENGVPLRVMVAPEAAFGTAMALATGSAAHLAALGELPAAPDEESLYAALGLPPIPPELREGTGEIEAARAGVLPALITEGDLHGDLHVHTRWSDGTASIAEMAAAALARGDRFLAVTDHSRSLVIAHGLGPEELRRQRQEIDGLQASGHLGGLRLLQGCEVEVLADGRLDLDDDTLAALDFVIASLHSRFNQDAETLTARALAAVRHPRVDLIGHPSGRRLPGREAYPIDLARLIEAAAAAGKALEVNGSPERLDLDGAWVRQARRRGVPLAIDSDAHGSGGLAARRFGVMTARRGWMRAADALNARSPEDLGAWLAQPRP